MVKNSIAILIVSILLVSCIDPVEINAPLENDLLVVEGFITDEFGPHEVRLSRLARFTGTPQGGGTIFPVFDAEVFLTDQDGNRTDMPLTQIVVKELASGVFAIPPFPPMAIFRTVNSGYRTPEDFRAEVGVAYTLNIVLNNGFLYQSTPQTLFPGPDIDQISVNFKRLPSTDPANVRSGLDVFSTWQDPVEESNFYQWRINGTYFIETPFSASSDESCLFDPDDGCCDKCFIEEVNILGNVLAFSDERQNGELITNAVGFLEDDGLRFGNESVSAERQYYLEVEQHTFSPEAFRFYRLLQSQLEIDGDLFDPPPAAISGNISRVNSDEEVIGFFSVNSVKRMGMFINRNELEFIQRFPEPCGDCRIRRGATVETPDVYRN